MDGGDAGDENAGIRRFDRRVQNKING
jgi:hypothetical protein